MSAVLVLASLGIPPALAAPTPPTTGAPPGPTSTAAGGPSTTKPAAAAAGTTTTSPQVDRQRQIDRKLNALKEEIEEATGEEAALLKQVATATERRAAVDEEIDAINRQVAVVQPQLDAASADLARLEAQQREVEIRLVVTRNELEAAREVLQRRAILAYTRSPAARYVEWLLRVRSMREAQTVSVYMGAALREQSTAVTRYQDLRREVEDVRDELQRAGARAVEQRNVVAAERARLEERRQAELGLRRQATRLLAEQDTLLAHVVSRKKEFQAQVIALQRQSEAIAASLRARQSSQAPARVGSGVLARPIPGAPVTSGFGSRTHPIYGDTRMHNGVDFSAGTGAAILSSADGVVVSAGPQGGYGTATVIDHGNTLATLYAHQSSVSVAAGSRVTRGQPIGRVGCTGLCTGPHLHFEVRKNGTPVDPMQYL